MTALAAPTDGRAQLYRGLARRNRIVAALRWLVPAAGAALLLVVVGLVLLDGLRQRLGYSNLRIDRDNLVVDTPRLTSTDAEGTLYALTARAAKVGVTKTDMIDMEDAAFTMTPRNGPKMTASAAAAQFQTGDQLLNIAGITTINSENGTFGTIEGAFVDLMHWTMVAGGAVDIKLPDGSSIKSTGMSYDRSAGLYSFTNATVTLMMTPGETR